jgi:gamma-glutamylaminecyclotransferase
MRHRVFVYGTLLAGEVNHHLLARSELLGRHRTEPRFTMLDLGAYPGVASGGSTAIAGEVYRIDSKGLELLDRLEDYPRLYDRILISSPYGRAWIYLYRGRVNGRAAIRSGDWRTLTADPGSFRAASIRTARDPKNPRWREQLSGCGDIQAAKR